MTTPHAGAALLLASVLACAPAPTERPAPVHTGAASPASLEAVHVDTARIGWGLVVHGGSGTITPENMTADRAAAVHAALTRALEAGYAVLRYGGRPVDAVVAALVPLEDSPEFNAGKGAVFNAGGTHSLDASIMDGAAGEAGAVANVGNVKNPILVARAAMERTSHVMLSGSEAEEFAVREGIEIVEPAYFYTDRRWRQLQRARARERGAGPAAGGDEGKRGTVGVVVLDPRGRIAAGTSTGGTTNKKWGRIGDSPIIGAGTYAGEDCGVSGTGDGEHFIRNVVAYDVCARARYLGVPLHLAARAVIAEQRDAEKDDTGGVIGLDAAGNVVMTFNTPGMYRGYIDESGRAVTALFR